MKFNLKIYKSILTISALLITFLFCKCNGLSKKSDKDTTINDSSSQPRNYDEVSVINLIATPEKYDGKSIRIIGYLKLEFENDAIYFHKEDYDLKLYKNSIGIEIPKSMRHSDHYKMCDRNYVFVEGTFDMKRSNLGSFRGAIIDINRIEINK